VTRLRVGRASFDSRQRQESSSSPPRPHRPWGPPSLLPNGYFGIERPAREADNSPPSNAEVNNARSYTTTALYVLIKGTRTTQYGDKDKGWTTGARLPVGTGNFSLIHRIQTGSEVHSASYEMGTSCSYPGGKADTSLPSNAEVNAWSYTAPPAIRLIAWCLIK
jgi:hypothetical protein